jgi:ankyrin repeat protein
MLSTVGAQFLINDQYQDALEVTPIFIAANNGHALVTEQLIEARCKVDLQSRMGARRYSPRSVRTLLSTVCALSLINTQDESGATPLHIAAQEGHAPVTEQNEVRHNVVIFR